MKYPGPKYPVLVRDWLAEGRYQATANGNDLFSTKEMPEDSNLMMIKWSSDGDTDKILRSREPTGFHALH